MPELVGYSIVNLFWYFDLFRLVEYAIFNTYIDVEIRAWVTNDDLVSQVVCKFDAPAGMLGSDTVEMVRTEEGRYRVEVKARGLQSFINIIAAYLHSGTIIAGLPVDLNPPVTLREIIIYDIWGGEYHYPIDEELGTVIDALPFTAPGDITVLEAASPVDLLLVDPLDRMTGAKYEDGVFVEELNQIPDSIYTGSDSKPEFIAIFAPITNSYELDVFGCEEGMYDLIISRVIDGNVVYENNYSNIGISQGETHRYTVTPSSSLVLAEIDLKPDTLNLKSKGKWVTCYIELPGSFDPSDVQVSSVKMNKINDVVIPPLYAVGPSEVGDYDADGTADIMVKFDREEFIELLDGDGQVQVTVTGSLQGGFIFQGEDVIRAIE